MQGGLEAAGDLATGGLIGRALEPGAGDHTAHGAGHPATCPNCQAALMGDFCHQCGQTAHLHRTLWSIVHDVLHGVYHFEGKFWTTLPMLFVRPGSLTRRYIAGERAKFVSPLALFLFSVFLMVATFETVGGPLGRIDNEGGAVQVSIPEMNKELAKLEAQQRQLKTQLVQLRTQRGAIIGNGDAADAERDALDAKIDAIDARLDKLSKEHDSISTVLDVTSGKKDVAGAISSQKDKIDINTGIPSLDARLKKALKSPELFFYKVQSNAYKFSWMLVPISLPFIWLLFVFRRDVGPYDHAIFAIYSLSAMTLGVVGLSVLAAIGAPTGLVATMLAFGPPLHIYKQLRGAYGIGRFAAAWRTAALLVSAVISGTLFFVAILNVVS
ncbi:DUF3667 domain-containing protein [Sphingomonas sp.]|uniref:DUF3667 domain-containing protein n=1 Tax=Sphingomonas sp. TaxID=28214 RepID=UPI001D3A097D|nr:DUF3667 domain-containing protein [Sphingomonas sp.]MBX9795303.1 DUF3667 domain-containing protein [Sphingomonas sp.]